MKEMTEEEKKMFFKLCKFLVQVEVWKSFREDAINEALTEEVYVGFDEWMREEREKQRRK